MSSSVKRKLTLSIEDNLVKTLKVKAVQYDVSVSKLVEVFALVAERDKKLFKDIMEKYSDVEIYVPDSLVSNYKSTYPWNVYADKIFAKDSN